LFEEALSEVFNDLPESEQMEITAELVKIVKKIKQEHPSIKMSPNQVFSWLMTILYLDKFGEIPAATYYKNKYKDNPKRLEKMLFNP
jgi:hypothetical protein